MTADTASASTRAPSVWRAPGFRALASGWVFTNLGDSALYLMAAVWVKELTGSDVQAALVFVCLGIPALLAPFLGLLADRVSRRMLVVSTNAAIVPVVASLFAVTGPGQVWIVYAVILIYGAAGYLTAAAQSGIIRGMLRDDQLAAANGILSTIDNGFRLIAPLVGTALYVAFGPHAVVVLTASVFAVAAVIFAFLPAAPVVREATQDAGGLVRELTAGFAHLWRVTDLRLMTVAIVIAFGATGLLNIVVFPLLDGLDVDPAMIGVLVPVQGVGAVVGGILSGALVGRIGEARAAAVGMLLLGAGTACLLAPVLTLAVIGMIVMGLGIPITVVAFSTLRQRVTPDHLQGRTSAAGNVAFTVPQTAMSIAGAGLLVVADYRLLLAATVVAAAAGAAIALRSASRRAAVSGVAGGTG
jgi:MFS family permease